MVQTGQGLIRSVSEVPDLTVVKFGHLVQKLLLLCSIPTEVPVGGFKVRHGQTIVDLPLQLGLVGGSEEVDSLDIQLYGEQVGEVEAGGWLLAVEALRDLSKLGWSRREQSDGSSRI